MVDLTRLMGSVLVVDDEVELATEIEFYLTVIGWQVRTRSSGAAALAVLAEDSDISVVVTDVRMPGMDGLELAAKIDELRGGERAVAVVLLTGHGPFDAAVTVMPSNVVEFLQKPVPMNDLVVVLARADAIAFQRRQASARPA